MLALPTILSTMTRWPHPCLIFRRSYTPTMRPRFSWWVSGIRRQSSNGPQKYNNMHIQRTFYGSGSCPYGQLVVLLGDYKGGGMMIVRCSTAPLMILRWYIWYRWGHFTTYLYLVSIVIQNHVRCIGVSIIPNTLIRRRGYTTINWWNRTTNIHYWIYLAIDIRRACGCCIEEYRRDQVKRYHWSMVCSNIYVHHHILKPA